MSQPSDSALNPNLISLHKDRRGTLRAWRKGKQVPVPHEVHEYLAEGHTLSTLWTRLDCFGGGIRPTPWILMGKDNEQ